MGAILGFGRLFASLFFHLGAMLASILVAGVAFLALQVVGPALVGATWQMARMLLGLPEEERSDARRALRTSPAAYALLSGTAWGLGYVVVRGLLALGHRILLTLSAQMGMIVPAWLPLFALVMLLFLVGSGVGLMTYRHETQRTLH